MYASGYMDHYIDIETYQSILVSDPESSSVIDSEEDTTEEGSSDVIEEGGDNDTSEGSASSSESDQDSEISAGSSGSDLSLDHNSDSSDMFPGSRDDRQEESEEGSYVGSGTDTGAESGDPEDREYEIIIRGDSDQIEELYRFLNGDEENVGDDFDNVESDSDNAEYESDDSDLEYVESVRESRDSEGGTESGTRLPEDSSDADEFYFRNIELLGIIAGCLYFIVFVIVLRYIYRFFRLFI